MLNCDIIVVNVFIGKNKDNCILQHVWQLSVSPQNINTHKPTAVHTVKNTHKGNENIEKKCQSDYKNKYKIIMKNVYMSINKDR